MVTSSTRQRYELPACMQWLHQSLQCQLALRYHGIAYVVLNTTEINVKKRFSL